MTVGESTALPEEEEASVLDALRRAEASEKRALFLSEASRALAASLDYRATLDAVARLAVPQLADWCTVDVVEPESHLRKVAIAHADPEKVSVAWELARRWPYDPAREPGKAAVLATGQPFLVPEITDAMIAEGVAEPERRRLLLALGPRSALSVPLRARGAVVGVLTVAGAESGRRYSRADVAFFEELAARSAAAIENARLYEEARLARADAAAAAAAEERARRSAEDMAVRLARLQKIAEALAEAPSVARVGEVIVEAGVDALRARTGGIWLIDRDGAALEALAMRGWPEETRGPFLRVALDSTFPIARVAASGEAAWVESRAEFWTRFPEARTDIAVQTPEVAFACLPVALASERLGVLAFSFGAARPFDEDERALLLAMSRQCAQAIARARLTEKQAEVAHRRADDERARLLREQTARADAEAAQGRLAFLAEASATLGSSLDDPRIFERMAQLAVPTVADWCYVDLVDEADGEPRRVAVAHADAAKASAAAVLRDRLPRAGSTSGLRGALRTGRAQLVHEVTAADLDDFAVDAEHRRALAEQAPRSLLCVPLVARARVLGTLTFVMAESGRRFSDNDIRLLEELARHAAVAMDNARLYADVCEADRAKTDFLTMLAHELRNPLAPIVTATQLARFKRSAGLDAGRALDVIDRQVQHLTRLVDDLLDVSRITRGKVQLRKAPLDVVALTRQTIEDYRGAVEASGLRLELQLPDAPLGLEGDATRLAQVFSNLIGNAMKFTDRGGAITVRVAASDGFARIVVADTGIGVPREMLRRIFDPFTQADRSLDRSRGGLGLGLAVVKGIVLLHGGTVQAASDGPGRGCAVTVALPLDGGARARGESIEAPGGAEPGDRLRILIVEDNVDAAETLRGVLEFRGHEVELAHTGPDGIARARTFQPVVVLCDLGLPGLDGFSVARALRAEPRTASAFLIAVSGYGQDEDRKRSRDAGFDLHLTKPLMPLELERVLHSLDRTL